MMHNLSLFLSSGGIKLLIFGFFLVLRLVRGSAKKSQQRKAQLRGGTAISDFSNFCYGADCRAAASLPTDFNTKTDDIGAGLAVGEQSKPV